MAEIQNISIELVKVHPNNVRKTYNDIEELAESIKAKGILQNLTVVPDPQEPGKYLTVIGNRRLTAARMAGLETVPCIVSDMDEKEQTSVMLLENIQRSDLTVYEQAQGFQMMLDLGETEDTIAEKTGFSKKTVRHRLNIAKLDSKTLMEKRETGWIPAVAYGFVRTGKDQGRKDKGQDFEGFHRFERFGKKSNQCSEGAETPGKHEVVRGNDEETGIKESSEGSRQRVLHG